MLFNKNDDRVNERIIYKSKPNMLFGCKKAIYGVILLIVVLTFSPIAIKFIGNMQVYLISYVNLSLTRYTAVAFFVFILFIIIYILWQLFGWYAKEYIITDTRVIVKSGVFSTKKNYMPYATIQDINTSQSIIGKIFGVGSINLYSAYDNTQMELSGISNVSELEDIIFTNMVNSRTGFEMNNRVPFNNDYFENSYQANDDLGFNNDYFDNNYRVNDDFGLNEDYHDEFEPITPIGHEKREYTRNEYEYYPEDITYREPSRAKYEYEPREPSRVKYEYEPYDNSFQNGPERQYQRSLRNDDSMNSQNDYYNPGRVESRGSRDNYYNQVHDEYSYRNEDTYQNNNPRRYYEENNQNSPREESRHDDSSENAIRRHFDKFKK